MSQAQKDTDVPPGLSAAVESCTGRYRNRKAIAMYALYAAEKEYGWLSPEAIRAVSESINVPQAELRGVATFYTMFRHKPLGRHLVRICTNVSCMLLGGERLVEFISKRLSLEPGGTSRDGRYSLVIMQCIGACDGAPAMLVDDDLHTGLSEENILDILERYE